jgi:D-alanine-D-alanine ligase
MKKLKVLVLEGGYNEEHEVSMETSRQVKKSLERLKISYQSLKVNPLTFQKDLDNLHFIDLYFNALHGTFGEDGKIQNILDGRSLKYTHSSANSARISFDKHLTKKSINTLPVISPKYELIENSELNKDILLKMYLRYGPFVIKPTSSGSSFGINIIRNSNDISLFIKNIDKNKGIYENHRKLIIEEFISGRELTVSVLEKNNISVPIEVTEIIPCNNYFDYESKYSPGYAKHIIPANIPDDIYSLCKDQAKNIHDKIGCKAISRSDFIYGNAKIYFLEINSQPGLTPISLVPEQLQYQNFSFDDLILNIIKCSL